LYELADFRRGAEDEAPDEGSPTATENAVRIMTIHGAKGLEAPIVLLADANAAARQGDSYSVLSNWPADAVAPRHFSLFSISQERGQARKSLFDDEAAIEERENWNLLYVAMTRAKQMLILSGAESARAGDWYQRVAAAVNGMPECLPETLSTSNPRSVESAQAFMTLSDSMPSIGLRRVTMETEEITFGIHFHAILERLTLFGAPVDPAEIRALSRVPASLFDDVYAAARNVIERPELRRFYDPVHHLRSFNEVEYIGRNSEVRRIDRLVEFDDCIWILDYKSGMHLQSGYVAQLNQYRSALRGLYPDKPIYCGLIFKDGRLEEVSES
jgi:ATP-dependent helicase/nuclease subunit A